MNNKFNSRLKKSLMMSAPAWCAFVLGASAACAPPATNGASVTCTGTDLPAFIVGSGVTGINLHILAGASITGIQQTGFGANAQYSAVLVNGDSTIVNDGTIAPATTSSRDNVAVNLHGSDTTFINNASGVVSVANAASGYRIYGVLASSDGDDFENVAVVNRGLISVTQNGDNRAAGVYAGENISSMTIDNFGTISAVRGAVASTQAVAAIDSDDDTESLTVVNHAGGTIIARGSDTYTVGGRAQDYTLINSGVITNVDGKAAILIYGGGDDGPAMATVVNTSTGVINGDVYLTDQTPIGTVSPPPSGAMITRDSYFANAGVVNGSFHYGMGAHTLDNSGRISGSILVDQTVHGGAIPGAGTFNLTNEGTIGGDITIVDRADSVNSVTLNGDGFKGSITAVNGVGSNSLVLNNVSALAGVFNFRSVNLTNSRVTVANGVSLVSGATLATTVFGRGYNDAGGVNGTLTLAGPTTLVPTFAVIAHNGDTYEIASKVAGAGSVTISPSDSALVSTSASASSGALVLTASVRDPRSIAGVSPQGGATLAGLLSYSGVNERLQALGVAVQALGTTGEVVAAGDALAPIVNGADVQIPVNAALMFHQHIDDRLDSFLFAEVPVSGRSADLGVAPPAYAPPANSTWLSFIAGGASQSDVNQAGGYSATYVGAIGGYDHEFLPGLRAGLAFGYLNTPIDGTTFTGNTETIQTYQGLAYVEWSQPNYYLRGSAGYGVVDYEHTRRVAFTGFTDTAYGSHTGDIFTVRGEAGAPLAMWSATLIPYAAFTYTLLNQNGYTESSVNGAALTYSGVSNDSDRAEIGAKLAIPLALGPMFSGMIPGAIWALEARGAYIHEFGDLAQTVSAGFVGGGGLFIASGPQSGRDMFDFGVGLGVAAGPVQIDLSYNGQTRSNYYQQYGMVRARYVF